MNEKSIDEIFEYIQKQLEEDNSTREKLLTISRQAIRNSSLAIRHLHRSEYQEANRIIEKNSRIIAEIIQHDTSQFPSGLILTAAQEHVESILLQRFLQQKPFPSIETLNVPYLAYLHGIPDFIGELRRVILDILRTNANVENAVRALDLMDELQGYLASIDYPDGLTHNLRRKTDMTRNLIEKTRGDVTLALSRRDMVKSLKEIIKDSKDDAI